MGRLARIAKAAFNEMIKPESFGKGEEFEQYIRDYIFPQDRYELVHRSHDYSDNRGDYIETTLQPDFLFRDIANHKEFFVEAKFRSDYWQNAIEWCKQYQLKRYKEIDSKKPVFIFIGVGGVPNYPEEVFLFPVRKVKYCKLFKSVLKDYSFYPDKPVFSKYLWGLLK